jgi:hypothetical protein
LFRKIQVADGLERYANQHLQPPAGRLDEGLGSDVARDVVGGDATGLGEEQRQQKWKRAKGPQNLFPSGLNRVS